MADVPHGLLARPVLWVRRGLAGVVALGLFAMMVLTVVDVTGRYLFSRPVPGSFEVMQFLLAIVVFAALPIVTHDRAHIAVSLFDAFFRGPLRRVQDLFVLVASAAALTIVTLRMWEQGNVLAETKAITGFLLWPIAPVAYAMSVLSGIALALLLVLLWSSLRDGPPAPGVDRAA